MSWLISKEELNSLQKHWNFLKEKLTTYASNDETLTVSVKLVDTAILSINNNDSINDVSVETATVSNQDFIDIMNEIDTETAINDIKLDEKDDIDDSFARHEGTSRMKVITTPVC